MKLVSIILSVFSFLSVAVLFWHAFAPYSLHWIFDAQIAAAFILTMALVAGAVISFSYVEQEKGNKW